MFPKRQPGSRMPEVRGNFGRRCQNKGPPDQPGMRNGQFRGVNLLIAIKKEVKIQCPRSPANRPDTMKSLFCPLKNRKSRERVKRCCYQANRVGIIRLAGRPSNRDGLSN